MALVDVWVCWQSARIQWHLSSPARAQSQEDHVVGKIYIYIFAGVWQFRGWGIRGQCSQGLFSLTRLCFYLQVITLRAPLTRRGRVQTGGEMIPQQLHRSVKLEQIAGFICLTEVTFRWWCYNLHTPVISFVRRQSSQLWEKCRQLRSFLYFNSPTGGGVKLEQRHTPQGWLLKINIIYQIYPWLTIFDYRIIGRLWKNRHSCLWSVLRYEKRSAASNVNKCSGRRCTTMQITTPWFWLWH